VSTGDSTDFSNRYPDKSILKPPQKNEIEIIESSFYYKTIVIFDSTDLVYLYQTDCSENKNSIVKYEGGCIVDSDDDYHKFKKYPNFIDLRPENILKFNNNNFIDFIKTNNDIFQLDTTTHCPRVLIIASNKDTIMNSAFYDLMNLINKKQRTINRVFCIIRMTTEEENNVIYFKRRNMKYNPENIKWSTMFLNGEYRPLTKQYDSIENNVIPYVLKAHKSFRMDSINIID
jgi:hypothetical protein